MLNDAGQYLTLVVGDVECTHWDLVDIDSDILTPADGWSLHLFNPDVGKIPAAVKPDADITIKYGSETVLSGVIDRRHRSVYSNGSFVEVSGRDMVGQLVDCSVPIFAGSKLSLPEIVSKIVDYSSDNGSVLPLPIQIKGGDAVLNSTLSQKIAVEPGEQQWTAIQKVAESQGLYAWGDPDGSIIIGNPIHDEKQPAQMPVIQLMQNGETGNPVVTNLDYLEDVTEIFSELHVLGQGTGDGAAFSAKRRNLIDSHRTLVNDKKAKFDGAASQILSRPRLRIIVTGQPQSETEANQLADKVMHDANLNAYTLTATVKGWQCATGEVWRAGWIVTVKTDAIEEVSNEPGAWVIFGRTLRLSRDAGMTTTLKMKRVSDWMLPPKHLDQLHDAAWRAKRKAAAKARRKAAAKAQLQSTISGATKQ